jgi:hypothetical protein
MMRAFRDICAQEGFDEHLKATLTRISAIESLGRTRELVAKDLRKAGAYQITARNGRGGVEKSITFEMAPAKPKP